MQASEKEALVKSIGSYIGKRIASELENFEPRLKALEAILPQPGTKGDPGEKGEQGEQGEAGQEGSPGEDGQDGAPGAQGEPGAPGEKGHPGEKGEAGERGSDGTSIVGAELNADGTLVIQLSDQTKHEVGKIIGPKGEAGLQGEPGANGKDGTGLAGAVLDRKGCLVLTLTDGRTVDLGAVVGEDGESGKDGEPGKDGRDGLGFDDLDVLFDGQRTFTFKMQRGEVVKEFQFDVPMMIYRGIYQKDAAYHPGDCVTWSGSLWHCQAETTEKPGEKTAGWKLCVKSGRDGKDGMRGERGERGAPGANGKDLTIPMQGR